LEFIPLNKGAGMTEKKGNDKRKISSQGMTKKAELR